MAALSFPVRFLPGADLPLLMHDTAPDGADYEHVRAYGEGDHMLVVVTYRDGTNRGVFAPMSKLGALQEAVSDF